METSIKDIINAGIGTVDTIVASVEENTNKIKNAVSELKEKGAVEKSETAQKLRELADDLYSSLAEYQGKASELVAENQTLLKETVEKYKAQLPEINLDEVKERLDAEFKSAGVKLDELKAELKVQFETVSTKVEEALSGLKSKETVQTNKTAA